TSSLTASLSPVPPHMSPPPIFSFASFLNLGFLNRLPMHVRGSTCTATFERHDVINDVALPPSRITRAPHEVGSCRRTALDSSVAAPSGQSGSSSPEHKQPPVVPAYRRGRMKSQGRLGPL